MAEFPKNTFLENLLVGPDGSLIVTSHEDGKLYKVSTGGDVTSFAAVDGKATGIVMRPNGELLLTGQSGKAAVIFSVDAKGSSKTFAQIDSAIFLNGIATLKDDTYLIADSYKGVIWHLDAATGKASIWLDDERLRRSDESQVFPAANGIKVANNTVYVSNTQKRLLLSIPVGDDGKPGAVKVIETGVNVDDFVIGPGGALYGATHVFNQVIKVAPGGTVSIIGDATLGLAGSTALAWGEKTPQGRIVYVSTNGGMFLPPQAGVEKARIVALTIPE